MSKQPVPKEDSALAAYDPRLAGSGPTGHEDLQQSDIAIPFIGIIQAQSPQLDRTKPVFIEEARSGDIFNSATRAFWRDGIRFVPAVFQARWNEWAPREAGGGFVNQLPAPPPGAGPRDIKIQLANGNDAILSHYHYVLMIDEKERIFERAVLALQSTQIKHSRALNALLISLRIPGPEGKMLLPKRWASILTGKTATETNKKGTWFGWRFDRERYLDLSDPFELSLFEEAGNFFEAVTSGSVATAPPSADLERAPAEDEAPPF